MRKLLKTILIISASPLFALAASGPTTLVNETGLAYNNTYPVNLNAPQTAANKLSVQITYGSATINSQTFTDGSQSTASITVASNNILAKAASNTITVPTTAAILGSPATAQITVVSTTGLTGACLTLNSGQPLVFCNGGTWTGVSTASGTASSIAAAINGVGGISANWPGGTSAVVYASATANGLLGNLFTIASSTPAALSTSSSLFSGGIDPALRNAYFTLNGNVFPNGYYWNDASHTSTGTAISITSLLNKTGVVVASNATGSSVIYTTAAVAGAAGNNLTLTATPSSGGLTIGGATFTGGQSAGVISINGVNFTAGIDFSTGTTAQTATNLAAAINSVTLDGTSAQATGSVVVATSTIIGTSANYALTTSTPAALTLSGANMTGGTNSGYNITTDLITIPAHGFTKALPLLYTGSPAIGGLATGTTYYAVPVTANTVGLSSTSAVAQTGNYIDITSSTTGTTAHTYTLAPLAFSQGSAAGKWQVSNDGINYADFSTTSANVAVASQTFTPVNPSTTVVQDFGAINYGYIRYNATAPTQGGVLLKVILNSKD